MLQILLSDWLSYSIHCLLDDRPLVAIAKGEKEVDFQFVSLNNILPD